MKELTILVVDDSKFMGKKISDDMHMIGYKNTIIVDSAYKAIEKAKVYKPDLVALDITMPELDGISAIKMILEVSPYSKIIMISAFASKSNIIECLKKGAVDFIVKPYKFNILKDILSKHLG